MGNSDNGIKGKISKDSIYEILIILSLCIIAFAFRIAFLDKLSFWIDESITVFAAKGLMENGVPVFPSGAIYQRSFVHVWMLAQTFKMLGVSEFSARLPSVLFGTLSVALLYYFAKSLGFKQAGLMAAIMIAFSPWAIWFSREARMYALFQFIYLASIYLFWLGLEGGFSSRTVGSSIKKWIFLILSGAGFVIGAFVHELMVLFLAVLGLYVFIMYLSTASGTGLLPALGNRYGITTAAFTVSGFSALVLLVALGKFPSQGQIAAEFVPDILTRGSHFTLLKHFLMAYPFLSVMAFIGSFVLIKAREKSGTLLLLSFWIPMATVMLVKVSRARYVYFAYPSFLLISAIGILFLIAPIIGSDGLDNLLNKLRSSLRLKIALIMVLVVFSAAQIREVKNQPPGRVPRNDLYVAFYPNWKLASDIDFKDKTIFTTDAITAYYYFGKVDYMVRLTEHGALPENERGEPIDKRVGARFLSDFDSFKSALERNKDSLIVMQRDLWEKKLTEEAREYIWKHLKYRNEFSDESIYVFTSN